MEGGKKVAIAVVLILVIVAAVFFQLKRSGTIGGPQPPKWVLERKSWKICNQAPYESEELMYKEWKSRGHKEGKYKDNTGNYTMVSRMKCAACEEWIPTPEMPRVEPRTGDTPGDPEQMDDRMAEEEKLRREYKCPKCGELAMSEMGPPR